MRIALVILHAEALRGGAERYTYDLAGALAAGGHEVSLLATSLGAVPSGVQPVELVAGGATRTGRYLKMLAALDRATDRGGFDIVHAMLPVRRCDVYHPHAGLAIDAVKALTSLANPRRAMFARIEQDLLERDDGPVVLCLSEVVRAAARARYPKLSDDRLATLFNAVDLAKFNRDRPDVKAWGGAKPGTPVLAIVAQDFGRKGVATAIAALARVKHAAQPMLVIAGGDRAHRYVRMAREMGIGDRVIFTGAMADVREIYKAAWALLLPTRHDPCSLVVLESLAMGVPVISTRMNGACEIMTDGREGFVMDRWDDPDLLARRIEALLDAGTRETMSKAALALRPGLAFERHVERLLGVYRSRSAKSAKE